MLACSLTGLLLHRLMAGVGSMLPPGHLGGICHRHHVFLAVFVLGADCVCLSDVSLCPIQFSSSSHHVAGSSIWMTGGAWLFWLLIHMPTAAAAVVVVRTQHTQSRTTRTRWW